MNCDETLVTCHNCLEIPRYKKQLKCCTFHPILPNYLIGQILSDESSSPSFVGGVLKHKISMGEGVFPLGLGYPKTYRENYKGPDSPRFGQDEALLCPYFDKKQLNCGIWKNRGSVCTSFYCKSSRGDAGLRFWNQMGEYLHYVEMSLAQWVLIQCGYSHRDIDYQLQGLEKAEKFDDSKDDLFQEPIQFYLKSLEIVETLDRSKFVSWMGESGERFERELIQGGVIWK